MAKVCFPITNALSAVILIPSSPLPYLLTMDVSHLSIALMNIMGILYRTIVRPAPRQALMSKLITQAALLQKLSAVMEIVC